MSYETCILELEAARRQIGQSSRIRSRKDRTVRRLEIICDLLRRWDADRQTLYETAAILAVRRNISFAAGHPDKLLMRVIGVAPAGGKGMEANTWARAANSMLRSGLSVSEEYEFAGGLHKLAWPTRKEVLGNPSLNPQAPVRPRR